jgi:hypothetical protein
VNRLLKNLVILTGFCYPDWLLVHFGQHRLYMQFTQFGLEEDVHISFIDFGQSESLLNLKSKILCACVRACVHVCQCQSISTWLKMYHQHFWKSLCLHIHLWLATFKKNGCWKHYFNFMSFLMPLGAAIWNLHSSCYPLRIYFPRFNWKKERVKISKFASSLKLHIRQSLN